LLIENRYGVNLLQSKTEVNPQQAQNNAFCQYLEQAHVAQIL
jgi:hypothetical protein